MRTVDPAEARCGAPDAYTETAGASCGEAAPMAAPARVGRYEILDVLGAGATGRVYRAHDPQLGRMLAIKLVRTSGASRNTGVRVLREARAMALLRHPNVVPIFDFGETEHAVFVAMPVLDGGTLGCWLRAAPHTLDAILDRFVAAGRGLAAAHAAGLVHRDFKPDNVLLGCNGEIQVGDFGLARLAGDEPAPPAAPDALITGAVTQTGTVLGTLPYMAPEQLRGGAVDARADQFSFCVALWGAIYGEPPFARTPESLVSVHALLDAIPAGPPAPRRRDRPAWIAPLLARGLAAAPERRWPTLEALLDAIDAHRRPPRLRWIAAGVAAVGLGAAAAAAWPAASATRGAPGETAPPAAAATAGRVLAVTPLAHHDDLKAAAMSPDGSKVAVITGDSLVIQGIGMDTDRVIVDHGVSMPIAWSPDSRHLAVSAVPKIAGVFETQLVDIEDRVPRALPVIGRVAFLSTTELGVVPSYRHRSVAIYRIGEYAAAAAICEVPGDYTFLWDIAALADGTIVVETVTLKTGRHALVMLRRDCGIRARFSGEPIAGIATTDTGTVIAIRDSLDEILEISPDGPIVSRRRVSGALGTLLGRRRGADYVTTLALKTDLVRVRGGVARQVFSIPGNAAFELSPDGNSLVWIERDGRGMAPGPLWLATPNDLTHSHAVFHNALTVGWSPDGARLAVLVSDAAPAEPGRPQPARRSAISLIVVDRNGGVPRRVPVADLDPDAAPVWLDTNRIATRSDDRTTYGWYDLDTGAQGELVDRRHGSTLWLARSPRDGTLAMWRIGGPGAADAGTGGLWLQPPGGDPAPLRVQDIGHFLIPSWSRSGELVVRAFETGAVSRVALDTGALAPIAQLAAMPLGRLFDDHVMTLPDGDLLAVNHELGANVAVVRDDEPAARRWQIAGSP